MRQGRSQSQVIGLQPGWVANIIRMLCLVTMWLSAVPAYEPVHESALDRFPDTPVGLRGVLANRGKHVHNVGNVLANITNFGIIGSMPWSGQSFDTAASLQWPAGSGVEHLFAAGLWVGARRFGEESVTAWEINNGRLLLEVFPGAEPIDTIYEAKEFQPGGMRAPAPRPDDDGDGLIDEDRLDGRDNDLDGLVDEDFAAISDQMFTCEYRDDDPRIQLWAPEHRPLGIHIRQTTMAWSAQETDDFIAFEYEITNVSTTPLFDVYLGFFADFDIGPLDRSAASQDDMAGFWEGAREVLVDGRRRNVNISIGYMFDDDGDDGRSPGYVGVVFLGMRELREIASQPPLRFPMQVPAQVHNFQSYTRFSSATDGGKPLNDADRYALLSGSTEYALGADGVRGSVVTRTPNDYSTLLSLSPLTLEPEQSVSLRLALVLGGNFDEMVDNAVQAVLLYEGMWFDVDGDPRTGVGGRELVVCAPEHTGTTLNLDCCPAPIPPECAGKIGEEGCIWTNGDCDASTGVGGRETQVLWTGAMPPPAPYMRIVGHENRIEIFWDNRSETIPDPLTQIVDFESYRVWRADQWTRPLGTTRRTGPGPEAWLLMSEYDVPGNGVGWDRGLNEIFYVPRLPEGSVEFYRQWFLEFPDEQPPLLPGLSEAQADTAQAMARGASYYRYVDPPFVRNGYVGDPCPSNGLCPPLQTPEGTVSTRCNDDGRCAEVTAPPKSGVHLFYSVTATDHRLGNRNGVQVANGPGLIGGPNTNFQYVSPPTEPLRPESVAHASEQIYVVPNPATNESMQPWALDPTNDDPTGLKIEFHHLPLGRGHVKIYSLSGDLIIDLSFDTRAGNGTLPWDLLSRNNQEVTSGVYLFVVEADTPGFERFVSRFVVIR